jgi:hypothetical protein
MPLDPEEQFHAFTLCVFATLLSVELVVTAGGDPSEQVAQIRTLLDINRAAEPTENSLGTGTSSGHRELQGAR